MRRPIRIGLYFIHNYFWDQHVSRISDQETLKNIKMSTENKLANKKRRSQKIALDFLPLQAMLL
jgi:hypothetical protein